MWEQGLPCTVPCEASRVVSTFTSSACSLHDGFYEPQLGFPSQVKFSEHQRWPLAQWDAGPGGRTLLSRPQVPTMALPQVSNLRQLSVSVF